MTAVELAARPLRFDKAQLLAPMVVLPGLLLAAAHAPVALLTFGPLVLTSWALARRDRYYLDRCVVRADGALLELVYRRRPPFSPDRGKRLAAVDLRYAKRQWSPGGDLILSEGEASYLAFGVDPPASAYPLGEDGEPLPVVFWRAVRLSGPDLSRLGEAIESVPSRPPPDLCSPVDLLEVIGSVGPWGRQAEKRLIQHLAQAGAEERPGGVLSSLRDLALRQDAVGQAAHRVLVGAAR